MNKGSLQSLAACMKRAERGEKLTLGFFGGSITQGSAAAAEENCYAYRIYRWWCGRFPQAEFSYVNAGIGGTTSHFGAARAEEFLSCRPDMVIVDFSVNDEPEPFFQETFEGLIRKLLSRKPQPALLILNNVFYRDGKNAQAYHNEVAEHYGLPWVSIKDTVWERIQEGVYQWQELTEDGLHPNDRGHELLAEEIIRVLEQACEAAEGSGDEAGGPTLGNGNAARRQEGRAEEPVKLPEPLTANAYENARRLDARNGTPKLQGFVPDREKKTDPGDFFRNGWIGRRKGDRIELEISGSCLAVQYRRTILGRAPVARVILDRDPKTIQYLDGTFDENWGDCLYLQVLLHHGAGGRHRIEIEIVEEGEEEAPPFYLLSLIAGGD